MNLKRRLFARLESIESLAAALQTAVSDMDEDQLAEVEEYITRPGDTLLGDLNQIDEKLDNFADGIEEKTDITVND